MSPDAPKRGRSRPKKPAPAKRRSPGTRNRLRVGEAIYLVAAVLLFAFMFLSWFGAEVSGSAGTIQFGSVGAGGNAWQSLEVIPIFLMLAIAVAVGAALLRLTGSDWEPTIPPCVAVTVTGGLAAILILIRIIFPPGFGEFGGVSVEATLEVGVFLALLAALGIAYGGWRAMAEEGTSFGAVAKKLESPQRPARPKRPARRDPGPRPKS